LPICPRRIVWRSAAGKYRPPRGGCALADRYISDQASARPRHAGGVKLDAGFAPDSVQIRYLLG